MKTYRNTNESVLSELLPSAQMSDARAQLDILNDTAWVINRVMWGEL